MIRTIFDVLLLVVWFVLYSWACINFGRMIERDRQLQVRHEVRYQYRAILDDEYWLPGWLRESHRRGFEEV